MGDAMEISGAQAIKGTTTGAEEVVRLVRPPLFPLLVIKTS